MKRIISIVLVLGSISTLFAQSPTVEAQLPNSEAQTPVGKSNNVKANPPATAFNPAPAGNAQRPTVEMQNPAGNAQRPQPRNDFEKNIFNIEDQSFVATNKEESLKLLKEIESLAPSTSEEVQLFAAAKINILVLCSRFDDIKKMEYLNKAIALSQDLLKMMPDQIHSYRIQASLYGMSGNHEKSLDAYQLLFQNAQDPRMIDAMDYVSRANIYFSLKKIDEACADLDQAEKKGFRETKELRKIFGCK